MVPQRIRELLHRAHILAIASHDLEMVREICNKVVWLDHGSIKQYGSPAAVTEAYERAAGNLMGAEQTAVPPRDDAWAEFRRSGALLQDAAQV